MRKLIIKPRAIRWAKAALVVIVLVLSEFGAKPVSAVSFPNGGFETQPAGGANDWYWPGSNWYGMEALLTAGLTRCVLLGHPGLKWRICLFTHATPLDKAGTKDKSPSPTS